MVLRAAVLLKTDSRIDKDTRSFPCASLKYEKRVIDKLMNGELSLLSYGRNFRADVNKKFQILK